jgi:hypothetical protein
MTLINWSLSTKVTDFARPCWMSSTIFQVSTFSVDPLPVIVLLPINNAITARIIQVSGDRKTDFIFML